MNRPILSVRTVKTGAAYPDKFKAILACGQLLVEEGHVEAAYLEAMIAREQRSTTYLGGGIAVPHGTEESRRHIVSTGLAVIQVPRGVDFGGGNIARLLVGIAARNGEHMDLLNAIACACADDEVLESLVAAKDPASLLAILAANGVAP